jgi:hypothetical protein
VGVFVDGRLVLEGIDVTTSAAKLKTMKWREISAPKAWNPKENGEELIGYYAGRTKRDGKFGQYEVVTVLVPYKGAFMVSGTVLIQLADAAMLTRGDAVRIVFVERKQLDEERTMKVFKLFVGEQESLAEAEMPEEPPS